MRQFRFAKEKDTVVIEASNRKVAEKRARLRMKDVVGEVLVSVTENYTVQKHYPTGEDQHQETLTTDGARPQE